MVAKKDPLMQMDTTISLDVVLAVVVIFGGIWRLNRDIDSKIGSLRAELKADIADLRKELKADIAELRTEIKADISELRTEFRDDIAELKKEIKAVDTKVDTSNQRLARLEGVILSREGLVDAITETDSTA